MPSATAPAAASEPARPAWPAEVPSVSEALKILTYQVAAPQPYFALTGRFLAKLSFAERAALYEPSQKASATTFGEVVAIRWRLVCAAETKPGKGHAVDNAAIDQMCGEIDCALAAIGELARTDDPELAEACQITRKALLGAVHLLVPTAPAELPAGTGDTEESQKLFREAVAEAALAPEEPEVFEPPIRRPARWRIAVAGTVLAVGLASLGLTLRTAVREEKPVPVPDLPATPPGSVIVGAPESGTVFLQAVDGRPLDPEGLETFTVKAQAQGAHVKKLGPHQALITPAKKAR